MSQALNLRPEQRTRRQAVEHLMQHSRAGALIQVFIRNALDKDYPDKAAVECRPGETNDDLVRRLLDADALLGRTCLYDAVAKHAGAIVKMGLDTLTKAMELDGSAKMIHPLGWFRAAEDAKAAMDAAQPDPSPGHKLQAWEEPQMEAIFRDQRGHAVDSVSGPASEVIAKAAEFMRLHGTDLDERATARPGSINFNPLFD